MRIHKNRIAWNFSGTKNASDQLFSMESPTFQLSGFGNHYLLLTLKIFPSGNSACCFHLRLPENPISHKTIQRCSYYLLNKDTSQHHKLVNFSPFSTDWFDLGITHERIEYVVILTIDFIESFDANPGYWLGPAPTKDANFEYWFEGKTEALSKTNMCYSSSYSAIINRKQYHLKITSESSSDKAILMDGLEEGEILNANFKIYDNKTGETERNLRGTLRAFQTRWKISETEQINKVELTAISNTFEKMDAERISEIAEIIENIDCEESSKPKQNCCELEATTNTLKQLQLPENISKTPAISASKSTSTTPTVTALPEQSQFLYRCFTESKYCDIAIQVSDGREIKAHKNMLFSGSTVWRELLTEDDQLSIIIVTDFEWHTIENLVTFIYTGSVPNQPPKQTDQLLIAAETYGVGGLKAWCEQELMASITIDSAISMLVLAHRYNAKSLFDESWSFVRKHHAELKQRPEWQSAFLSYPELGLQLFKTLLSAS